MPDTLKEFFNSTIDVTELTGNQTATLFTNNSTTRAVIKDVAVTNGFPATPNLTVGGTAVAALSGRLTGSEIADVSQAVAMSFASPLALASSQLVYLSVSSPATQTVSNSYTINGTTASTTTANQVMPAFSGSASLATAVYYAPDGDVFSIQTDGNQNWFLFKNAGSASGTQTTVNTGFTSAYRAIAFDNVNTFYWLTSQTNLRAFNADTETTTDITLATLPNGTTYARLLFSNGHLLHCFAGSANPYLIEISTGRWAFLDGSGGANWNQSATIPGFYFDPATRVVTWIWHYGVNNNVYRAISPSIPSLTAASVTFSSSWSLANLPYTSFQGTSPTAGYPHYVLDSADGGVTLEVSNYMPRRLSGISGPTSGWTVGTTSITLVTGYIWRPRASVSSSPTVNTTNFPSTISLRLTGVEVTA